jgi:hypothetical protein
MTADIINKKIFAFNTRFPATKLKGIKENSKFKKLLLEQSLINNSCINYLKKILDILIIYLYHYVKYINKNYFINNIKCACSSTG